MLRILQSAHPLELRGPLLDLDREHMVVELGLQLPEGLAQLRYHVRREWEIGPVVSFSQYPQPAAHHVEVRPPAGPYLGATQAGSLHQGDCWPLSRECS